MMRSTFGSGLVDSLPEQDAYACQLFRGLPRNVLKDFESIGHTSAYIKGVSLFKEGQNPRGIYLLRLGRAKLITCLDKGEARITRIAGAGEVLGLSETIAGLPYEATAETITPSRTVFVSRANFLRFLREHPRACFRVVQILGHSLHASYRHFSLFSGAPTVAARVAGLLLNWSSQTGEETSEGVRLEILLTHRDIARLICSTRETVTRTLGEFKRQGLLELSGTTLIIRDMAALMSLLKMDPSRRRTS
jgi:CRP/FNR family transcriptional regulator